ncbi:hypothetical protein [Ruminococcus sp.]|uniref:hypothetical protein n=1 Tax=Ruminococcus sp. TaxID=41978 RepID=UPI0025E38127|nr:hypothetical protein [Ruminococcus sp.]MBR1432310.1 interferon alpha-inducible IFI6/IFI27 family protein [Ruminococcus sp.]
MYIVLFVIIGICLVVGGTLIYWKATNKMYKYWEIVRFFKRREVEPHMNSIRYMNSELSKYQSIVDSTSYAKGLRNKLKSGADKAQAALKVSKERHEYKKTFDYHKNAYNEYLQFCRSKGLDLSFEENQFIDFIDETEDLLYPEKALDRELQKRYNEYDREYNLMSQSGQRLFERRNNCIKTIDGITALINSIAKHPKDFDKEIGHINSKKESFKETIEFAKEEQKRLKQSAIGVGTGVTAGTAVATMAPTAAMWVATTFGTASTGTAISALSGAAATNAALAWLGGGALVAGGGGMAAGQALLALAGPIGWGLAGTSVLASILMVVRKKKKIQEEKKQEIERIINCTDAVRKMRADIDALIIQTDQLNSALQEQLLNCSKLMNQDYTKLSAEQKQSLGALVNNTNALATLIGKVLS